jgi:hypothetical protein
MNRPAKDKYYCLSAPFVSCEEKGFITLALDLIMSVL